MADNTSQSTTWAGSEKENRRSYRRQTIAEVSFADKNLQAGNPRVLNLSLDGAFIQCSEIPPMDVVIQMKIVLPFDRKRKVQLAGRVARHGKSGFGVQFIDLHARDRSLLRQYVGFHELDDAIVSIQKELPEVFRGNMLPVTDREIIEERLNVASEKKLLCLLLLGRKGRPIRARMHFGQRGLILSDIEQSIPERQRTLYVSIIDGPLQAVFEGLIFAPGKNPEIFLPERMYLNDRRWSRRTPVTQEVMIVDADHLENDRLAFPLLDRSEGGCSVRVPSQSLYTVGMRFPEVEIHGQHGRDFHDGATITRISTDAKGDWILGLQYIDKKESRDTFAEVKSKSLKSNIINTLRRASSVAVQRLGKVVKQTKAEDSTRPNFVRSKNTKGESVAGLIDATFDIQSEAPAVDVAVVIAPPFPVRKEVFSLLSRTLVENFIEQGKQAVVLRFDMTHVLGESYADPELLEQGNPYLNWTFSHLESDIAGSITYLQRQYTPAKRVLISYSVSAIPSRRLVTDAYTAPIDHWLAPFGCPDGQDMQKNLLAGVDLIPFFLAGQKAESFLIYGRLYDPNPCMADGLKKKLAFVEDARKDMEKIKTPITWIVGTYDFMVTRGRVREMLSAPGGGVREIIELTTGHNPRTGEEAIESFKIMYESLHKHIFGVQVNAIEPNLHRYEQQRQMEWARSKKNNFRDMEKFWTDHILGTKEEQEGYDVLLYNPEYVKFIEQQADLLEIKPDLKILEFGCGTGNLTMAMLSRLPKTDIRLDLQFNDLIRPSIDITRKKVEEFIAKHSNSAASGIRYHSRVVDLETTRLMVLDDFLNGRLFGPEALNGRIEGLNPSTLQKLGQGYNQALHEIMHGRLSSISELRDLCPSLEIDEAEEVLELSRASRYLRGEVLSSDLRKPGKTAETTADLHFSHLNFGKSTLVSEIDYPTDSVDRIAASLVMPYIYDGIAVLREFYRILQPGGLLVFSSLKPNYDASRSYIESAELIAKREDMNAIEKERLLRSLQEFSAFIGRLMELEDEGRFTFYRQEELERMTTLAGFKNIQIHEALTHPSLTLVVKAEKK
jgi:ubiquinone/menaquinone biosynthesis C-methylase UbiE